MMARQKYFQIVRLTLIILIVIVLGARVDNCIASIWETTTVDSNGYLGMYTSITLDASGKVHISYYDSMNNYDLKYATNASGSWVTQTIDSDGSVGYYTDIAIDTSGKVHISYLGSVTLKYATNASGSWVTETIDSIPDQGLSDTSIAVDTLGKVYISYLDSINWDMKYATNKSGAWVLETVDSIGNVGFWSSIAIDASGKAHISYWDMTNSDLKYATNASGSWVTQTIDSDGEVGRGTSIALDASWKVHISYLDMTNNWDIKYATNKSGVWVIEKAAKYGYSSHTSIGVDASGKVHIGYQDSISYDLNYATNESGAWVTEKVDSVGDVGGYNSIAVGPTGKVHFSYIYNNDHDLKYAKMLPTATILGTPNRFTNLTNAILTIGGKGVTSYKYWLSTGPISLETDVENPIDLIALEEGPHTISVIVKDTDGDWQPVSKPTTATWIVDMTPPTGTIKINADAEWCNILAVTLSLAAMDLNGASQMQFSNDNSNWSSPEDYATTRVWSLTSGDGDKMVYVKVMDVAGNWSSAFSKGIILDTAPPTIVPSLATGTYVASQTISLSSEVGALIYYTLDGSDPKINSGRKIYSAPIVVSATSTLKFYAIDTAGNTSDVQTRIYTIQYTMNVNRSGTGTGSVASNPTGITCGNDCTETYNYGTLVTLTAVPDANSTFMGWSGGGCFGTAPCTVTIDGAKTISATFAINTYTITATAAANGTIDPSVTVNYGSNSTFLITPNINYHVADVLVDGVSVGAVTIYNFTNITAAHTIAASFAITANGSVVINTQPDAVNTTAPWILTDPNSHSQSGMGDQTLSDLPIGDYTIIWGDVPGWFKPSPATETKALTSGGTITFNGTYIQRTIPVIQVTPLSLNFNYVPVGSTKDLFLTVKNTGGGTLTGNATTTAPFSIVSGGSFSLGPDQEQIVTIRYQPTSPGSHTGTVVFTGGDGATVSVTGKTEKPLGLPWLLLLLGN